MHEWALATVSPRAPEVLRAEVSVAEPEAVRWAGRHGYVETARSWESRLDVSHARLHALDDGGQRAQAAGVVVVSLAAVARGATPAEVDAIERQLFSLNVEATADIPTVDPIVHPDFEAWRTTVLRLPGFVDGAIFLAQVDGQVVGTAQLEVRARTPGVLHQGFLGVRRAWRGRGVAQLLKCETVREARRRGAHEIRTFNNDRNHVMMRINERVGFVRQPATIDRVRHVRPYVPTPQSGTSADTHDA